MTAKRRHIRMARAAWRRSLPLRVYKLRHILIDADKWDVIEASIDRWHRAANGRKA